MRLAQCRLGSHLLAWIICLYGASSNECIEIVPSTANMVRLNCTLTALQKKRITVNHSLDNIEIAGRYAWSGGLKKGESSAIRDDTGNGPRPSLTAVCYANVGGPGYNR